MKFILNKYLKNIQKDESIFPMDSFPKKKKSIIRTVYPEQYDQEKHLKKEQKRIMIDVDGVLHTYENGWDNGKLKNVIFGAKEALSELHNDGFEIVIFSTRASGENPNTKQLVQELEEWLNRNDLYFDQITGQKLGAILYIDDRAINFKGDWKNTLKEIKQRTNI